MSGSTAAIRGRVSPALLAAVALVAADSASCRWREGREVWLVEPDSGGEDPGEGYCGTNEISVLAAEELWALIENGEPGLAVVDIRSASLCELGHIPGALCLPWDGERLQPSTDPLAESLWVVVYDASLDPRVCEAAATIPVVDGRTISVLADGLQGWAASYDLEDGA